MTDRPKPRLKQTMAGVLLAAAMSGTRLALPTNHPRVPPSPEMRTKARGQRLSAWLKAQRREENRANRAANRRQRSFLRSIIESEDAERGRLFDHMTGWQASQYARAGRPKGIKEVRRFATMPRRVT